MPISNEGRRAIQGQIVVLKKERQILQQKMSHLMFNHNIAARKKTENINKITSIKAKIATLQGDII